MNAAGSGTNDMVTPSVTFAKSLASATPQPKSSLAIGTLSGVAQVAAGNAHTCVLTTAGGVKCWGRNDFGQLGDGTSTSRSIPRDVSGLSSGVQAIAAGDHHTCAVTNAGALKCWGHNIYGALGNGTTAMSATPVDVSGLASGVQAIAAGDFHSCAVLTDGSVKCWGYNNYGQLGDGSTTNRLTPTDVSGLTAGVSAVAGGYGYMCALTGGGGVKCWGYNNYGQLGDGSSTNRLTPVDVSGLSAGVGAVAAGYGHTCALTSGGGVKCWGYNNNGQLGDGTTQTRLTSIDVVGLASGVSAISAGNQTCALTTGGGMKCWGYNGNGQLGDATNQNRATPVDVAGLASGVTAIAARNNHSCAALSSGAMKCWGDNGYGQLGNGLAQWVRPSPSTVVGLGSGVSAIAAGTDHTCAVTAGGGVKCWGSNTFGPLGDGTKGLRRATPADVAGLASGVSAIVAGMNHTCALTTGGGVKCWGGNGFGEVGDGSYTTRVTPVDVVGLTSGVSAIAAGIDHTCALTTSGGVKCWGRNDYGQVGNGMLQGFGPPQPTDVIGLTSGVSAISAGGSHTCALTTGGGVKCWGSNSSGVLGDGTTTLRLTPVDVIGLAAGVTAIAAGSAHTCALNTGGGVKCWGDNYPLGTGTNTSWSTPAAVWHLDRNQTRIAAGQQHTCSIATSGGAKCWGSNTYAQIGDGTTQHRLTPADVGELAGGVDAVAAGGSHTCALTTGGAVKCWGRADYGAVGDGLNGWLPVDVLVPVADRLGATLSVQQVAQNQSFSLSIESRAGEQATPVLTNTTVQVALAAGVGNVGGTKTCTIPAGSTTCGVSISLDTVQAGAVLVAHVTSSDALTDATSSAIDVATLPGAPVGVVAVAATGQITVTIEPPTNDGGAPITGYYFTLESSQGNARYQSSYGSGVTTQTITNLTNGWTYTVTAQARNVAGTGPASPASNAVVLVGPPYAPTVVFAAPGSQQATVTFASAPDGGSPVTGYTVTSSPAGGLDSDPGGLSMARVVTGLTNGTSYQFCVRATNALGASGTSCSNNVVPNDLPGAPQGVVATAGPGQALVSFAMPASDGGSAITGYRVTSNPPGGIDMHSGQTGLAHVIIGLDPGTSYSFTAVAITAAGTSAASAPSNSIVPTANSDARPLLTQVSSIAMGRSHVCALTSSGAVKCWGLNSDGQLGEGTTQQRATAVDVTGLGSGVVAIAGGYSHTCALTSEGGVKCWGNNRYGQLGDGSTTGRLTPVGVIGLASGVQAIAGGDYHTCAVLITGALKCWGVNWYGQLGDGTTQDRVTPVVVSGFQSGVKSVSAGENRTCALTNDGAAKCWGYNTDGELGDASTSHRSTPVDVWGLSSGVNAITMGHFHTCALMSNGVVKCWGFNGVGQFGDGGYTWLSKAPVDAFAFGGAVTSIVAGYVHTCALTSGGAVKCSGKNNSGQLGDGTLADRNLAVDVLGLGSGVIAIAARGENTCAVMSAGTVKCWGYNFNSQLGAGSSGQAQMIPGAVVAGGGTFSAVATGGAHACALTSSGDVKCWGANGNGQLGDGSLISRLTPVDVGGLASGSSVITAGRNHTCTVVGGVAKCWGQNDYGQIGDGSSTTRSIPVGVSGLTNTVQSISAGYSHSCAVLSDGSVKCWGGNNDGRLGDGTTLNRLTPVDVSGLSSVSSMVATGWNHTCAVTTAGALKCWGWNGSSQVGDGTTQTRLTPVEVSGLASGVQAVGAGWNHTCAVTTIGAVKCWGDNVRGQLGDGTTQTRSTPVDVIGLTSGVTTVATGGVHTCALTTAGGVKCWGFNGYGQLGNGTTQDAPAPVDVAGLASGVVAIAASWDHTCALLASGTVKCWGYNASGELGNGLANADPYPALPVALPRSQTLSFTSTPPSPAPVGGQTYVPTAIATSGLPVTISVDASASAVCALTAGVVSFKADGLCVLNANQAGTEDYEYGPAPQVQQTFMVGAPSHNADLATLTLSEGTLTPSFAADTTSYTAAVPNATTGITLTATVADTTALMTINSAPATSGVAFGPIALDVGSNAIVVAVTAQDGTTIRNYTVVVTRAVGSGLASHTSLTATPNPARSGQAVTFTAEVATASGTPTGSVTFTDGAATLGTVALSNGSAVLTTAALADGIHVIRANYPGDASFGGSLSAPLTQGINSSVAYDGNGHTGGSAPVDSALYAQGATVTILGNPGGLTRNGYAFAGWNTAADGTGIGYGGGATFTMGSIDFLLYAQWTPNVAVKPTLVRVVATGADPNTGVQQAWLLGRVDGAPGVQVTLNVYRDLRCDHGVISDGAPLAGTVTPNTDAAGYFGVMVAGIEPGDLVAVQATSPASAVKSRCVASSGDNDFWPKALDFGLSATFHEVIDAPGRARWYKFRVTPGQKVVVTLSGLPADYDLAVFKDIGFAFESQLLPADTAELTKLSAEYAPSVFSPSEFSPSVFSPSVFSPDAFAPSVFSPSVFSPSVFSPSVFSPSVFSPSVFSPSVFSPSVFSPSVFSPSVFSPSVFSPSVFSPAAILGYDATQVMQAFSSAQSRSIVGVSAKRGKSTETVTLSTGDSNGYFYARVTGRGNAHSADHPFTLTVARGGTNCTGVAALAPSSRPAAQAGVSTVILTDSSRLALNTPLAVGGTLAARLAALASRVGGVIVDVDADSRVRTLRQQAGASASCPYATNLLGQEIKSIVDAYRVNNPGLRYVVIVGSDSVIPFFRYPDESLLGSESGYVPPVAGASTSEASLRQNFVLSQDAYGSSRSISMRGIAFPIPDLAVGRLVESAEEIAGMIDTYLAGGVVRPASALVSGYDFLTDAAEAVRAELRAGMGVAPEALITPSDVSPQDPASWTAPQLATALFGSRHDFVFLAGHFSANSALAADFASDLLTSDLEASTTDFTNTIVVSAGCHSGYNIVDADAIDGVTMKLDWPQALARKKATLVAGTGYQYGDTDFLEYSERLYLYFTKRLRAGVAGTPVALGEALVKAKIDYLSATPEIRGIHQKALLEATVYGLPMLGVDLPRGRTGSASLDPGASRGHVLKAAATGVITPTPVASGPANVLGLQTAPLSLAPTATAAAKCLKNPPFDAGATGASPPCPSGYTTAQWLAGPDGVVSNPAEPVLPLQIVNVTPTADVALRGVGFVGGTATEATIVPLTGAPTTELRGVHTPFMSPLYFPMRMWTANYFGALAGTGQTSLLVTPVQHRTADVAAGTSTRRQFTGLELRLFYSGNKTQAALSDAPTIVGAQALPDDTGVTFAVQVVGDPAAAIHEVWVTYTGGSRPGGAWTSLGLTQCGDPAPAVCGLTTDSKWWMGRLSSPPANLQYLVQAVNGVGLVSADDNLGALYAVGATVPATPTLTLMSPPATTTYGTASPLTAILTAGGLPLANAPVTVSLGGSAAAATTSANGQATLQLPVVAPGSYTLEAAYAGDVYNQQASWSGSLIVERAPASLAAGPAPPRYATLTAAVGGGTQTVKEQLVRFDLAQSGAGVKTLLATTNLDGRGYLPPTGLPAGQYTVTASFAGNALYGPATQTIGTLEVLPQSLVVDAGGGAALPDAMGLADSTTFTPTSSVGLPVIVVLDPPSGPGNSICRLTAAGATYTLVPLAPGSCTVVVRTEPSVGYADATYTKTITIAGAVNRDPVALSFGGQSMNTTSPAQTVTITNASGTAVSVASIATIAPFAVTHSCGTSLSAGASCTASVTFTPTSQGGASGVLMITVSGTTLSTTLSGVGEKSLVTHFYQAIMRRTPDAGGKSYWEGIATTLPTWGASINETWFSMAMTFYSSPEYQGFRRDDTGFVTDLYRTFFNREPDSGGLDYWTGVLSRGTPREVVLASFMFSTEFVNFTQAIFGSTVARAEVNVVMDFYRGLLGRLPDQGGFDHWLGQIRTAQCVNTNAVRAVVNTISQQFLTGGEYLGRERSNPQFVGDLYNSFLRRGGDEGGVAHWITQLNLGNLTREQERATFLASPEFSERVNAVIAEGCRR